MKFNPAIFAGGVTGGLVSGNTGDGYEVMPTAIGMSIGGTAGAFFNHELPRNVFDNMSTEVDTSTGVTSYRRSRADYFSDLTEALTKNSQGVTGETPFDPSNPISSVSETNLKSALRYYEQVSEAEIKKALTVLREGEEAVVKFNPTAPFEEYTPASGFVQEGASLEDKVMKLTQHLEDVEFQNVPSVNQTPEMANQRAARVAELTPFLDRLEGKIIFEDGQMRSILNGQTFNLPLTQTLTDGQTLGHNINNNVYTSNKFNIMGSVIASGAGGTVEGASEIANNMGLQAGSLAHTNVVDMLVNKAGITREATLGVLASTTGVSDKSLLGAVERLSEKKQWDESATSLHAEARVDTRNGVYDDYRNSEYTRKQASLVDMGTTIKHDQGTFGDLSESALRGVRTSTATGYDGVESHKIRREVKDMGMDRVSGVKADHSLVFTPADNQSRLVNVNNPYNRNTGSITNRALSVTIKGNVERHSLENIKGIFGAESQLGSAVKLSTALFDEDTVSRTLSEVLGANVTLDDGYAIGNQASFANFEHTGYTKVKLQGGSTGSIVARSPMINQIVEGSLTVDDVKELGTAHLNFRGPRPATLERANLNFASATSFARTAKDAEDLLDIGSAVETRYQGLEKMLTGIYHSTEKELRGTVAYSDLEEHQFKNMKQGIVDYFAKRTSIGDHTQTTEYGRGLQSEVDALTYEARSNFLKTGDMEAFTTELGDAVDYYRDKREVLRQAAKTAYPRGGSVVGFGVSGEAERVSKSYDNHELMDVETRVDAQGRRSLEATYKGTTNLGDSGVVKTFSVNFKDQNIIVDENTFVKAGMLAEYTTDGTVTRLGEDRFGIRVEGGSNYITNTEGVHEFLDDNSYARNVSLRSKYKATDTISSLSGAGYGAQKDIMESIKTSVNKDDIISKPLMSTILEHSGNSRRKESVIEGLVDFVYASSNEKPSTSALVESISKGSTALDYHTRNYEKGHISKTEYLRSVGHYGAGIDLRKVRSKENIIANVRANFDNALETLKTHYGSAEGLYEISNNAILRKEVSQIFVSNAVMAAPLKGSIFSNAVALGGNIHTGIVAMNRKAETETGAGTTGKSMSWNAQTQLLANGYEKSELDLFASFDKAAVNDMQALTGMTRKHDTLLNKHFESNSTAMRNVMQATPSERRQLLEDAFGYNPHGSNVDFYNLHYKPETGIKSIPLIFDESRGFDSYTDTKDTGALKSKRINGLMSTIIDTDIQLKNATDHDDILRLQGRLDTLHTNLEDAIKPTLSGTSGALKAAMTREGDASLLSTVGAVNGQMVDFTKAEIDAGRSGSYAGVSYHGALDRLKLAGVEFTEAEEADFLRGNSKHLEDIDGYSNLKRLKVTDDLPLFGFVNREPSQGPMSIRTTEYLVDTSLKGSEMSRSSIYMGHKDPFYKFLQFGDYDFDTMTEYFAKSTGTKENHEMLQSVLNKGRKLAEDYADLRDFSEKLGVKNNKDKKLKSLFDILEENPDIKNYEDWHAKYLDSIYEDTTRAGLRKTISPKVTMLASQLNNSLMASTGDLSSRNIQAGRVLSHYFVENLLKAQHSSEDAGTETVAEKLSRLREVAAKSGNSSEYIDELVKGLTGQLKNINPNHSDYQMGQDAIKSIVTAEKTFLKGAAINPMELGGALRDKNLGASLDIAGDVYAGRAQAIGLHKTVKVDGDVADLAKVGYDRFKTTAKQLFHNNKKVLGYSAAGLAGVAIAFRENPDESYKQTASADVGRHSLTPNKMEAPTEGQPTNTASEYVTPHRDARRAVTVEGQYVGNREDARYNTQKSLFGDSIESAQVEYREE